MSDIDLKNEEFTPIGSSTTPFTGTFDGMGHSISNLKISRSTTDNVGLFGQTSEATIRNLDIRNVNLSGRDNTGALAGFGRLRRWKNGVWGCLPPITSVLSNIDFK